jgi:hypothetical protein
LNNPPTAVGGISEARFLWTPVEAINVAINKTGKMVTNRIEAGMICAQFNLSTSGKKL